MKKRRSLTPSTGTAAGPTGAPEGDLHATRRGGARREVSARVTLKGPSGQVLEGWALNVSKGGVRVILEEKVELGTEFEVTLSGGSPHTPPSGGSPHTPPSGGSPHTPPSGGSPDAAASPAHSIGRIVWVQEEPDGVIAGIEFCAGS